jgi:hypothetical protein
MSEIRNWPGSIVEQAMLEKAVGAFLRTHLRGDRLLLEWMASVPADRTEAQYDEERAAARAQNEENIRRNLERVNAERAANGAPPIDRQGNVQRRQP